MKIEFVQISIRDLLTLFVIRVKAATAQGDTFFNRLAETFLVPFLSEVYNLPNLENLNQTEHTNFPAIDLADKQARVAFQITSTTTSKKIKETLQTFTEHHLYEKYDRLIIYILSEKQQNYSGNKYGDLTGGKFSFDKDRDIVDFQDMLRIISGFDIEKAERVLEILERNLGQDTNTIISKPLSPELKANLAEIEKQLPTNAQTTEVVIEQMLEISREFLDRYLIDEAAVFLSKIDLLLLETSNYSLINKADLLRAILCIRNEQILEAKQQLLRLIANDPKNVDAMLEYIELCDNITEPEDNSAQIKELARDLAQDHPRFLLIELSDKFKRNEEIEIPAVSTNWTSDIRLNARFLCQYALICDATQKREQRDAFINRWEETLPNSPRPHLLRVIFKASDFFRSPRISRQEQAASAKDLLQFSITEKERTLVKDPLTIRNQLSWLIQDAKLNLVLIDSSGSVKNLNDFRGHFTSLIEQCYFDKFIDNILIDYLGTFRTEPDQWQVIVEKIEQSQVLPSAILIDLLFLQAIQYTDLYDDLGVLLKAYGHAELLGILQAIIGGNAEDAAKRISAKQNPLFTLNLFQSIAEQPMAATLAETLKVDDKFETDWLFAKLKVFDRHNRVQESIEILRKLPLDTAIPHVLMTIAELAYKRKQWELFIPPATRLLNFDIPQSYKSQIHAQLALAYFDLNDETNAINHADQALAQGNDLSDENAQVLLHVLGESLKLKGQTDKACEKFEQYEHVKRSFPLLLEEADLYLKSSFPNRYEKALALVMRAFEEIDTYSDEIYFSASLLMN